MSTERKRLRTAADAAVSATVARYRTLPLLPSWQTLTRQLAALNRNQDGPDTVWLYCEGAGWADAHWTTSNQNDGPEPWPGSDHSEHIPGDGKPFDAAAAARRLLSFARGEGFK